MEGLCSRGQLENADCCCACKYPLPVFCAKHAEEHANKDPGHHFTLPIRAVRAINSKQDHYQFQEWLFHLKLNFAALRERYEEFSGREDQIEAVYQDLQQHAVDAKKRLHEEFSVAKAGFLGAIESAIKETSSHAADSNSFVPVDPFSQLLWYYDPGSIASYQIYTFQANSDHAQLDSAFQVTFRFAMTGYEHLKVGQDPQPPSGRSEEEVQDLRREAVAQEQRCSLLKKKNSDLTAQVKEKTDALAQQALNLSQTQTELEAKKNELQTLRMVNDSRISALEKELTDAVSLNKDRENQLVANFTSQLRDKEDLLTTANNKIYTLEQHCAALTTEKNFLIGLLQELQDRLSYYESMISGGMMPQSQAGFQYPIETSQPQQWSEPVLQSQFKDLAVADATPLSLPAPPLEKLIAVLNGEVKYFDVATSQWQQLCALRREIIVDYRTSSTFIAPTTIFLCGGVNSSTCHVDRAYMLQADNGSVQELPHMSDERRGPGVAWDSERKALYVFGGGDGNSSTCYTDLLRTSEMFLSNQWSPLPEMHQGRLCFTPCWHSCLVYLCGGDTNSVETYDPRSNTFALQDFTLPETSGTTAVVQCGVVTVISHGYISKLQQGRFTSQMHPEYYPWSNCTPVVSGGAVYVVKIRENCCRSIDLTTGALRKEVSLR